MDTFASCATYMSLSSSYLDEKKAKSDAQRLESLEQKRQLAKQRQSLISESLKNVDRVQASKRIVFDSDADSGGSDSDDSDADADADADHHRQSSAQVNSVPLFEDAAEESDNNDVEEMTISNRHFGLKGAKLMAMEAKFGNDERFRLTERFADDLKESEEELDDEAKEIAIENKNKLEILSRVLGKKVRSLKLADDATPYSKKPTAPFKRFDPDNPQHVQWLEAQKQIAKKNEEEESGVKSGGAAEGNRSTEQKHEEDDGAEQRIVEGHFFDVDESFVEALKQSLENQNSSKGTGTGTGTEFSFLKSIGRVHSSDDEEATSPLKPADAENSTLSGSFRLESSTIADAIAKGAKIEPTADGAEGAGMMKQKENLQTMQKCSTSGCYFFIADVDHEVANCVENFRQKQNIEDIRRNWSNIRLSVIKIYKGHRKQALKRKKEEEQLAYRKRMHRFYNTNGHTKTGDALDSGNEPKKAVQQDKAPEQRQPNTPTDHSHCTEKDSAASSSTGRVRARSRKRARLSNPDIPLASKPDIPIV